MRSTPRLVSGGVLLPCSLSKTYQLLVKVPRPKDARDESEAGREKIKGTDVPLPHTLVRVPAYE